MLGRWRLSSDVQRPHLLRWHWPLLAVQGSGYIPGKQRVVSYSWLQNLSINSRLAELKLVLIHACELYYYWSLLYSTILHSRADSLHSHVILHEWIAFYSAFFWKSTEVVYLQRWHGWCHKKLLPSQRVLCTLYNHAPCHFMQSHICKVYACLAVTCHLCFWQNDRGLLCATVVTQGWNGYRNNSQHRKLTLEKKILPPPFFFFRILWKSLPLMQNPQCVVRKIPTLTNMSIKSYHHIYNVHWIGKVVYFQKLCRCFLLVFFNFKGSTKNLTMGFVYPTSVTQCTLCTPCLLHNTHCVCHFAPQGTAHCSLVSAPFRDPVIIFQPLIMTSIASIHDKSRPAYA